MAGRTKTKTLLVFTLLICSLLLPTAVLATNGFDADKLRAQYTSTLVELAGSYDYVIECGNSDVLNSYTTFSELELPLEVAVCTLKLANNNYAVIFSSGDEAKVLDHLPRYFEDDQAADRSAIYPSRMNMGACDDPQTTGDDWRRCTNAIKNNEVSGYDTHVFARRDLHSITYLVTINFVPEFGQGWWSNFLTTLRNLFRLGDTANDIIEFEEGFARGYFAKITSGDYERKIHATFQANNPTSNGRATIIFDQFVEDVSELAPDARRVLGSGKQALIFDEQSPRQTISPARWKQLTSTFRINPISGPPHPDTQTVCGDARLDFGEQCDGDIIPSSCEALGFVGGTLSCYASGSSNECTYDVSNCIACQDRDDDGHPANNTLPSTVRAIMSEPLIGLTNGDTNPTATAQTILVPAPNQELVAQLDALVTTKTSSITEPATYTEYRAAAQDITALTNNVRTFLQAQTNLPTTNTVDPIVVINLTNIFEGTYGSGAQTNVSQALRTTLWCAAISQATKQLEGENTTTPFLFYFDELSNEEHNAGYWFCREGLRTAGDNLYFTNALQENLFTPTGPRIDAIVTSDPESYVRDRKIFVTTQNTHADMTYRELRRALNGRLIVQSPDIISAYRANPVAIIVPQAQYAQANILSQELYGHDLYIPRINTLATTPLIIKKSYDTETMYIQPLVRAPMNVQGINIGCAGTLNELRNTDNTFVSSNDDLQDLKLKKYRYTIEQASCLLGTFPTGGCPVTPTNGFDCNDNNPQINPNATQICDGQDNNCDGSAANPSECVMEMCDTRPIELENVVVKYDANVNFDYRYHPEGASCTNPGCGSYISQGIIFSTPKNDVRAFPLHRWWNSETKNNLLTRAGDDCAVLPPAQRTITSSECAGEDLTSPHWELKEPEVFSVYPANQPIHGTIAINRFYVIDGFGKTTHMFVEQGSIPPHIVTHSDGTVFRVFGPNTNTIYEDPCDDSPPVMEPITPPGGIPPLICGPPPDDCRYISVCNLCFGEEWQCHQYPVMCP